MIKCRLCHSDSIASIIPLGELPLANSLLEKVDELKSEKKHNLEVLLCGECGLAQLKDLIDPKDLFSDYVYFSSNSDTMLQSAKDLVEATFKNLGRDSLVVEIASNDGYLLKNYTEKNIPVLGIDPAENIADVANKNGINTICDFFGVDLAKKLASEGSKADVIHANNVMAHVPDINGFVEGIKILLKDSGKAIIEVPYFADLVEKLEFDTIYHEHVFYFAVKPLKYLFEKHGLEIFNIQYIPIHGGSLRVFVGHRGYHAVTTNVESYIEKEKNLGLYKTTTYVNFMKKLSSLKDELHKTLSALTNKHKKICAYGASAKGTTLLNYFGIGKDFIDFIVDRGPAKQWKFSPGMGLEIFPPEKMLEEESDFALLLAWNFSQEIIEQQSYFTKSGGKFIIPLPEVKII
ncbi:MAG: methyltransferase [Rickettsiales bacterium]|nr:methyltransferase [Rickettsiales bacterium]|tara:strand:+ start:17509 stop:18723 length:1215 start_codon:yes stop_codon:yes gene_type:complete